MNTQSKQAETQKVVKYTTIEPVKTFNGNVYNFVRTEDYSALELRLKEAEKNLQEEISARNGWWDNCKKAEQQLLIAQAENCEMRAYLGELEKRDAITCDCGWTKDDNQMTHSDNCILMIHHRAKSNQSGIELVKEFENTKELYLKLTNDFADLELERDRHKEDSELLDWWMDNQDYYVLGKTFEDDWFIIKSFHGIIASKCKTFRDALLAALREARKGSEG